MKSKHLLLTLLMALLVPWAANAQEPVPYSENFDGMSSEADLTAAGWISDGASGCYIGITTSYYTSGGKALLISAWDGGSNSDSEVAALPVLNASINTLQITLSYRQRSGGTVKVGYLTDANDASTFVSLESLPTSTSGFTTKTVDLSSAPSTAARIAIQQYTWYDCYIDDITVEALPSCSKPTLSDVASEDIEQTSATIRWTPSEGNNLFDIYYATTNTNPTTSTTPSYSNVSGTSKEITDLNPATQYYVWLRGNCGTATDPDISGGWTEAKSFNTACGAINVGYQCGFEGPNTVGTGSYKLPTCWSRPSGTSTSYPGAYNYGSPRTGSYHLYFYGSTSTTAQIAVLPEIDGGVNGKRLSFYQKGAYSFSIGYMTDPDDASTFEAVYTETGSSSYTLHEADFSGIEGNPHYMAIKSNITSSYGSMYFDDVELKVSPTCLRPTMVTSATEIAATTAKVSWTPNGDQNHWDVYYCSGTNVAPTASIVPQVQYTTDNPCTLTNLTPETTYYVYVRGNCGTTEEPDYSEWSINYCTFTTKAYCEDMQVATYDINAVATAYNAASVSWEGEATQWKVQCSQDNTFETVDKEVLASETSADITGLTAEKTYYVRVAPYCSEAQDYTPWSSYVSFATPVACPAPTNLGVTDGSITANEATITWNGTSQSYVVMIGEENIEFGPVDFENQIIPADWTNDATYPWVITDAAANSGTFSMMSGNYHVSSSTSSIQITATFTENTTISFDARCSCEQTSQNNDWDYGTFCIDGVQQGSKIVNSTTFTHYTYNVEAGTHTFMWKYKKDSSENKYDDCLYVDDIVISAGVPSWTEYTTNNQTYTFDNLTAKTLYQVKVKGNCGDAGYSTETETISFTTLASCFAPTATISDGYPTAHGVSFTWNAQEGELFQYAMLEGTVTDFTSITWGETEQTNTASWNDLIADQDYTFALRKYCSATDQSEPVSITFHTLIACPAPTGLALVDNSLNAHGASFTWDAEEGEVFQWAILEDGVTVSESDWSSEFPANNAFTGYNPETKYFFYLRKNCTANNDGYSVPASISFTTTVACPAPTGFAVVPNSITSRTVDLTWEGTSESYNVTYGALNTTATVLSTDFEDNAIPAGMTNSTYYPWTVTAGGANGSGYCAISGNKYVNNSNSDLTFVVTGPGTVSFYAKVSSEDGWDNGYFLIDGSEKVNISGTKDWTAYQFDLTAGTHTLIWRYSKDTGVYDGDDLFYVDDITITGLTVGEWHTEVATEVPFSLENLLPNTSYQVKLQGDCGSEGPSAVVGPITFTTNIACPAPKALHTVEGTLKSSEVGLSWINGGAENWVLAYKKTADDNFTEVNLATSDVTIEGTTVTYTLTGLDEQTPYDVKVQDNCEASIAGDGVSEWTATTSFTTMAACSVLNVTVSNVGHFTANVNWDGESQQRFTVKYREAAHIDGVSTDFTDGLPTNWINGSGELNTTEGTATITSGSGWGFGENCGVFDAHAYLNLYGSHSYWLITPSMNISAGYTFTFDVAYTAYSYSTTENNDPVADGPHKLYVLISTDDKAHWTVLREWNNTTSTYVLDNIPKTGVTIDDIDISTYAGQTAYIAFLGVSSTTDYDNNIHIDNVTIGTPVAAGDWQTVSTNENTANLSELTAGTTYDLTVVPNCDETLASEIKQFTTVSGDIKWFITEGNWDVDANWEPAGAPTIEQDVVLKANATIASGEAFAKSISGTGTGDDAKTLTIESGAKLKHLNGSVRATVKKHINSYTNYTGEGNGGYYLIANPMTSSVTPSAENGFLVGNYDLYSWSYDAYDGNEWRNYEAGTFTSLNSGAYGYLYANETGTDLTYTGTINAYTSYKYRSASVATNPDSYSFPSWYLLGNPYLYDAYLADYSSNGTALPYIKMNADGDGFEAVAAGTPIEPMQGFFYQGVTVESSAYVVTYEPTVQDEGKLNMNLRKGNKQLDNAILVFGGEQQMSKMTFRANSSKIYMPVEGKDFAIASTESNVGEMPVNFKAEKDGSYTLSFTSQEVSFSYLHLIDNMTGADVDLLANPSYTFNALTTDFASRFRLVFATGSSVDGDSFGFINGAGNLNIFGIEGEATVQVIDVLGHVISTETFSGSYERKLNVAPGVYMIRLIQGNDVKVQKMVVR